MASRTKRWWMACLLGGLLLTAGCPSFPSSEAYACQRDADCAGLEGHTLCDTSAGLCVASLPDPDGGGGSDGGSEDGGGTDGGSPDGGATAACPLTQTTCGTSSYPCEQGCCDWNDEAILHNATPVTGVLFRESLRWTPEGLHLLHSDALTGLRLRIEQGTGWDQNIDFGLADTFTADFVVTAGWKVWIARAIGGPHIELLEVDPAQSSAQALLGTTSIADGNGTRGLSVALPGASATTPTVAWVPAGGASLVVSESGNWSPGTAVAAAGGGRTASWIDHTYTPGGQRVIAWLEEESGGVTLRLKRGAAAIDSLRIGDLWVETDFHPPEVRIEATPEGDTVVAVTTWTGGGTSNHGVEVYRVDGVTGSFDHLWTAQASDLAWPSLALDLDGRAHVAWVEDTATLHHFIIEPDGTNHGPFVHTPSRVVDGLGMTLLNGCAPAFVYESEGSALWLVR
ncbi:MAG: hypothetical protein P1V51_11375 [Deltaproteobacteria bacterium]|nr:hypothetical protein [Deltaproteobacteria bacterium]